METSKTYAPWSDLHPTELYRSDIYLHLNAIVQRMKQNSKEEPALLFVTVVYHPGADAPIGAFRNYAGRVHIRIPALLDRFQPIYVEFLKRLLGHFERKHDLQPPTYVFADMAGTSKRKHIGDWSMEARLHLHAVMVVPPVLKGRLHRVRPKDNQLRLPSGFVNFVRNVDVREFPATDLLRVTSYASKLMSIGNLRYGFDELFSVYPVSKSEMSLKSNAGSAVHSQRA